MKATENTQTITPSGVAVVFNKLTGNEPVFNTNNDKMMKATENTQTPKYALLWVDEFYTPGIKFFATLAEAEEARGKKANYIVEVKLD